MASIPRVPTEADFKAAIRAYRAQEIRGPVCFNALARISTGWGNADEMSAGIGLLLRSWHNAFYRFGSYDPACLTACIDENIEILSDLRERTIGSFSTDDEPLVRYLFNVFTNALKGGKNGEQRSTVATAKAMHLLAPAFLPLWDNYIAGAYGQFPMWANNYIGFCWQMKELAVVVEGYMPNPDDCTILKRIDEFNYAIYTKSWVTLATAK